MTQQVQSLLMLSEPPADIKAYRGRLLIGGEWMEAASGKRLDRESPAHGKLVATYAAADAQDAAKAVAAARAAFDKGPWPRMKGVERANILLAVAAGIEVHVETLALQEALESGKPLS